MAYKNLTHTYTIHTQACTTKTNRLSRIKNECLSLIKTEVLCSFSDNESVFFNILPSTIPRVIKVQFHEIHSLLEHCIVGFTHGSLPYTDGSLGFDDTIHFLLDVRRRKTAPQSIDGVIHGVPLGAIRRGYGDFVHGQGGFPVVELVVAEAGRHTGLPFPVLGFNVRFCVRD